jgi:hypothetical protein
LHHPPVPIGGLYKIGGFSMSSEIKQQIDILQEQIDHIKEYL